MANCRRANCSSRSSAVVICSCWYIAGSAAKATQRLRRDVHGTFAEHDSTSQFCAESCVAWWDLPFHDGVVGVPLQGFEFMSILVVRRGHGFTRPGQQ